MTTVRKIKKPTENTTKKFREIAACRVMTTRARRRGRRQRQAAVNAMRARRCSARTRLRAAVPRRVRACATVRACARALSAYSPPRHGRGAEAQTAAARRQLRRGRRRCGRERARRRRRNSTRTGKRDADISREKLEGAVCPRVCHEKKHSKKKLLLGGTRVVGKSLRKTFTERLLLSKPVTTKYFNVRPNEI